MNWSRVVSDVDRRHERGVQPGRRRRDVLAEHPRANHVAALGGRVGVGPRVAVQDRPGRQQARIAGDRPGVLDAGERRPEAVRHAGREAVVGRQVLVQERVIGGQHRPEGPAAVERLHDEVLRLGLHLGLHRRGHRVDRRVLGGREEARQPQPAVHEAHHGDRVAGRARGDQPLACSSTIADIVMLPALTESAAASSVLSGAVPVSV